MTDSLNYLEKLHQEGFLDDKLTNILKDFYVSYQQTTKGRLAEQDLNQLFEQLIHLIKDQIQSPYSFDIFHKRQKEPFNFYQFGLKFIEPLIDFAHSRVDGLEQVEKIQKQVEKKENVILFSNHQIEADPQIIHLLLKPYAPQLVEQMIFVAGHRVTTDPLAVPISRGCNLLCIYSKKHINFPIEDKPAKIQHNQKTLNKMKELLAEGGKCIYVAPSGGRDRCDANNQPVVAPFDPQSVELFWLITKHLSVSTHFYPLALKTYNLMPPPPIVEHFLGEKRLVQYSPVYLSLGKEINMPALVSQQLDKKEQQSYRSEQIWKQVCKAYATL